MNKLIETLDESLFYRFIEKKFEDDIFGTFSKELKLKNSVQVVDDSGTILKSFPGYFIVSEYPRYRCMRGKDMRVYLIAKPVTRYLNFDNSTITVEGMFIDTNGDIVTKIDNIDEFNKKYSYEYTYNDELIKVDYTNTEMLEIQENFEIDYNLRELSYLDMGMIDSRTIVYFFSLDPSED